MGIGWSWARMKICKLITLCEDEESKWNSNQSNHLGGDNNKQIITLLAVSKCSLGIYRYIYKREMLLYTWSQYAFYVIHGGLHSFTSMYIYVVTSFIHEPWHSKSDFKMCCCITIWFIHAFVKPFKKNWNKFWHFKSLFPVFNAHTCSLLWNLFFRCLRPHLSFSSRPFMRLFATPL
jgi:hypothetical protein